MKNTILALSLLAIVNPAHAAPAQTSIEVRKTERLARWLTQNYQRRERRRLKHDEEAAATQARPCSGDELRERVAKVETLTWHHDLAKAQRLATRSGKPILWIQALGDLSGLL